MKLFVIQNLKLRSVLTIANNVSGIIEMIHDGQTGYVVGDQAELILRMKQMIQDNELALRMGQNASDIVGKGRLIEHEIKNIEKLFIHQE